MNATSEGLIQPTCPSCKSADPIIVGPIPSVDSFAGRPLSCTVSGGNLYRCPRCQLSFRYPRLTRSDLDKLYQDANSDYWQYKDGARRDWILAKNWLQRDIGRKILDVGCWDGEFLSNLPGQWERFGIEINKEAAVRARNVGVHIISDNVYQSEENLDDFFDVITAFDIIEHLEDPGIFLTQLIKYIRPGGHILIGTGNTDVWQWKIAKGRYWYCWTAEHISFINKAWFKNSEEPIAF